MKLKNVIDKFLNKVNSVLFLKEFFSLKKIYVYYALPRWRKNNYNWGDDVNSVLINLLSQKSVIPCQYSFHRGEHYLCIGSIIQWYSNKNSIIWGSGLLYPVERLVKPKKVLAVRGPLTRDCLLKCGIDCPPVYGDPVLLFPRFYHPKIDKRYKLGIICHCSEIQSMENVFKMPEVLFIDIRKYGEWTDFIDKILSCECVLSSSLHGIIVSDAYSIPNAWCRFTNYVAESNGFKFRDYYLSVNKLIDRPLSLPNNIDLDKVKQLINGVWTQPIFDENKLLNSCPFKV